MSNPTNNYIGSFHFRITVEGINDPLDGFMKVSSITSTTENVDFKHGLDSSVRKAPGRTTFDDVTLERVYSGLDEFYAWRQAIEAGNIDRRTVSIEFLRSDHTSGEDHNLLREHPAARVIELHETWVSHPGHPSGQSFGAVPLDIKVVGALPRPS